MSRNLVPSIAMRLWSTKTLNTSIYNFTYANFIACPLNDISKRRLSKKVDFGGIGSLGKASKKKLGKLGPVMEKKILPVEEDPVKLVNYVCGSNIMKEGEDIKLKPDSEYPEWLWTLRTGKLPPIEEMDPNTKEYWKRVRTEAMRQNNKLAKLKKF